MTATVAALVSDPAPFLPGSGVGASLDNQLHDRVIRADYSEWIAKVESVGDCTRPVRLARTTFTVDWGTGEVFDAHHDRDGLPDGVVYKRCGTRLASVCPSCSEIYRHDAYHLIRAGITGGKRRA